VGHSPFTIHHSASFHCVAHLQADGAAAATLAAMRAQLAEAAEALAEGVSAAEAAAQACGGTAAVRPGSHARANRKENNTEGTN
jgi:hypothetical protein